MARISTTQALAEAWLHIGVAEDPDGSNRTPFGDQYGWTGVAWCAIFIWCIFANIKAAALLLKKTASTPVLAKALDDAGRLGDEPRRGALVFYAWYGPSYQGRFRGICHVGIVEEVRSDGKLVTIEGNVGNAVKRLVRSTTYVAGYGYPDYLDTEVAPAPEPTPTPAPTPTDPELKLGSRGSAVKTAQERLNAHGASVRLVIDGAFGPKTDAAVKAFQRAKKLDVDGIVGPDTWRALKAAPKPVSAGAPLSKRRLLKLASPRMRGKDVTAVQSYLMRKGYSCGRAGADGIYGPATEGAVRRYQTKRLPRYIRGAYQWDGIVGPRTWGLIDAGR